MKTSTQPQATLKKPKRISDFQYPVGKVDPLDPFLFFGEENYIVVKRVNKRKCHRSDQTLIMGHVTISTKALLRYEDTGIFDPEERNIFFNEISRSNKSSRVKFTSPTSMNLLSAANPVLAYPPPKAIVTATDVDDNEIDVPDLCPRNDLPRIKISQSLHDCDLATKPSEIGTPIRMLSNEPNVVYVVADYIHDNYQRYVLLYKFEYLNEHDIVDTQNVDIVDIVDVDVTVSAFPYQSAIRNEDRSALIFETIYFAITNQHVHDVASFNYPNHEPFREPVLEAYRITVPTPEPLNAFDDVDDNDALTYAFLVVDYDLEACIEIKPTAQTKYAAFTTIKQGRHEPVPIIGETEIVPLDHNLFTAIALDTAIDTIYTVDQDDCCEPKAIPLSTIIDNDFGAIQTLFLESKLMQNKNLALCANKRLGIKFDYLHLG